MQVEHHVLRVRLDVLAARRLVALVDSQLLDLLVQRADVLLDDVDELVQLIVRRFAVEQRGLLARQLVQVLELLAGQVELLVDRLGT